MNRGDLAGAVLLWALLGGDGRAPSSWSTASLVADLMGWGVPRSTAYRWASSWAELATAGGVVLHPRQVAERQLRRLILRRGGPNLL